MTLNSLEIFCILFFAAFVWSDKEANVCKTFFDYYTDRNTNENCYYNPDVYLQVPEIIQRHGYPVQIYTVTTKDGYILTMFRIPCGKNSTDHQPRPPVFIQHGIGVSSIVFVNIGQKSLAFTLVDNGYDVWLGNFRGTEYSNKHVVLSNTERSYWDFTFHENGVYDLPAQLNVVVRETKQKIVYIGYSMGTTAYFVYNVEFPDLARQTIRVAISLAPIAYLQYLETPLKALIPLWLPLRKILYDLTDGVINQRTSSRITERANLCLPFPVQMQACQFFGGLLYGFDRSQEDPETFPVITMQDTDSIGIKTVEHYIQIIQSGQFRQFDHGFDNYRVYGNLSPPGYNLSKIYLPNYFVRGNNDPLATERNVEETYNALPKIAQVSDILLINYSEFTHADFIAAKDVKELLYDYLVTLIKMSENEFF